MTFRNLVAAGVKIVREMLTSANYVEGVAGWALSRDGDIQADNLLVLHNMTASEIGCDMLVTDSIDIGGRDPLAEIDALKTGSVLLAWGFQTDSGNTVSTTETGLVGISAVVGPRRMWRLFGITQGDPTVQDDEWFVRIRGTLDGSTPSLSSPILSEAPHSGTDQYATEAIYNNDTDDPVIIRAILTLSRRSGTGSWVQLVNTTYAKTRVNVYDEGPSLANMGWNQPGTATPPAAPTPDPVAFTYTFRPTWDASYRGDSVKRSTPHLYQGFTNDSGGSINGNNRALIGFNYADIAAKLAGATITSANLYLSVQHTYQSAGARFYIGTHTYTAEPSTWSSGPVNDGRLLSGVVRAGDKIVAALGGSGIIADLATGSTARGIAVGPYPTTAESGYGYLAGMADSGAPYIVVKGTK